MSPKRVERRLSSADSRLSRVEDGGSSVGSPSAAIDPDAAGHRRPIDVRSAALTVVAVLAIVMVLKMAQAMIIPIVLGVLISYALDPMVIWMTRLRLARPLAAAILLAALVGGGCALLYGLRFE